MYICKECGAKFAQKVEYCDCGNNTFDYIEDKPISPKKMVKHQKQPLTIEQKSEILSRLFLVFCIILSIIIWLIPVKVDNVKQETTEVQIQNTKDIPPIDKFWDNTPVYVEKRLEEPESVLIDKTPISLTDVPDYAKPKPVEQKRVVQQQKPKIEQKQVKSTAPKNQSSSQRTTKQKQSAQLVQKTQLNNEQKSVTQKQMSAPSPKLYEPVTPKTTRQEAKIEPQKPAYNPNSPEMLRYKGNLRAAMFSKFAVGSIQGSGSCSVKFSVDSTGKLINRSFVKQSDNKSLNDAVYYMMMSVPKFSPPPSGYNGETIQMNFKINNGSYEISIY